MPVESGGDKVSIITDPNDAIPKFGTSPGTNKAHYSYNVDNGATRKQVPSIGAGSIMTNAYLYVKYAAVDVHTSYFNTASKSANILNKFWDRAVK